MAYTTTKKKILAFILIICLMLCTANIPASASGMEEKNVKYTIQCKVEGTSEELSDFEVILKDSSGKVIDSHSEEYELIVGEKYEYTIKMDGIQDTSGEFTAEEKEGDSFEKVIEIPLTNLISQMDNKKCYVGETVSINDKWKKLPWEWSSSSEQVATVKDGVVTGIKPGTAIITRSYNGIEHQAEVTVEEYVKPLFTIDGIKLENITELKEGATVKLKCTNYNQLSTDTNKWQISISGEAATELTNEEYSVTCSGDKLSFTCQLGSRTEYYTINIFEDYVLSAYFHDEVIENAVFTPAASDLKPGVATEVTVTAEGFQDITVDVTPVSYEREIEVSVGEMQTPNISYNGKATIQAYCGGSIDLNAITIKEGSYNSSLPWKWYFDGNPVEGTNINLMQVKEGTYIVKYVYCNEEKEYEVSSNEITVKVDKLKLEFDFDNWVAEGQREYDTTDEFDLKVPLASSDISLAEPAAGNKKDYSCLESGDLEIKVKVNSTDASKTPYTSLTVEGILVSCNSDMYDLSLIKKETVGKVKNNNVKLTIDFKVMTVTRFIPYFEYRTQGFSFDKTNETGIFLNDKNHTNFTSKLLEMMGTPNIIDNENCNFSKVQYDEANNVASVKDKNVEYVFDENTYSKTDDKKVTFTYEYTYEILHIENILDIIQLKNVYKGPDVKDSFWVNGKDEISASLKESSYNNPESAYNGVSFKKIEVIDWDALEEYNISGEGGSKGHKVFVPSGDDEEYYAVMFDTENYEKCSTVAAIIRIIPKENRDFSGNYPCRIPDTDDEEGYPVITLFQDGTAAEVDFADEEDEAKLDRTNDSHIVVGEVSRGDNIKFTVTDNDSGVKSVKCAIVPLDLSSKYYNDITKTYNPAGVIPDDSDYMDKKLSDSGEYTMNLPSDDGEYVICVKTINGSGLEETYISNGFFIDSESPEIIPLFVKDKADITKEVINGEEVYSSETIRATIKIKEKHLRCGQVIITKMDYEDNPIDEEIRYEFKATEERDVYATEQIKLEEDANYQIKILAIDKAGNTPKKGTDGQPESVVYNVTVDTTVPNGKIETALLFGQIVSNDGKKKGVVSIIKDISKNPSWTTFVPEILYSVFSKDTIQYTMSGSDKISPVEIRYYLSAEYMTEGDLNNLLEESWHLYDKTENNIIEVNESCIIYGRVKDKAGNISYFSTQGMITDNHKPDIMLSLNKEANKNGFYNGDVSFSADIEDKIPEGGTASSGLQYVSYYLEREGKIVDSSVNSVYDKSEKKEKEKDTLKIEKKRISAKEFNSNDVTLCVTAIDNAGNKSTEEIPLKIDNVKPEISVTYDDQAEGQYCNRTRTATISIKERNLNTDDVKIVAKGTHGNKGKVGKWSHSGNTGKSDNAVYTCKVTFTEDDDYEFTVSCVDKAGNKAAKNFSDKFTVDATKPVISVSYNGTAPEQNAYYKEPITATITITEHNFNAGKVDIQMHADNSSASGVSGFSSNGDVHTATVSYGADGTYGLDVAYTDEAGNAADSYSGSTFTVDLIEPEIEITNIQDKSANKGDVKPVITCTDVNYDSDKAAIKLYGANNGEIDLKDVAISSQAINNGEQFTLDFPETQILDDVYTLTAEVTDKAGNETEKSIEFSVNRFGSVYTLGTETGEWLTSGECSYIQEGRPVVIVETNVDEVVERNIAYTQGGVNAAVVTVNEEGNSSSQERENGTYYQMKDRRGEGQWYRYEYTICADNFLSEGRYSVQIDSTDRAGNHTSNVSNKRTEGNLVVEFAVDQTAPSAVVTGADNREVYNEASHTVYLDVQDNLATDYVTIYLNGEEYGTYKASDIEGLEDGLIPVKVGQSLSTQTIQLMAKDMAGNVLSEKSEGKYDKSFDDFHIIVTTNPLVRFLHTTWFWLLLLMILVICGISVFIIIKRKKMQVEN